MVEFGTVHCYYYNRVISIIFAGRCIIISDIVQGKATGTKKYRMKKGLKLLLVTLFLASLCSGGFYFYTTYPMHIFFSQASEPNKETNTVELIRFADTSSVYLYDYRFQDGHLEILGMLLNPDLQYRSSEYQIHDNDLYFRIQVEPSREKKLKEFTLNIPCERTSIKNIYIQGSSETDRLLKWQIP